MATVAVSAPTKQDWIFANPWFWHIVGGICIVWSCLWTLAFGTDASDSRVIVLAFGLLLTAVGVWLRWNDRQTSYLAPYSKLLAGVARLAMGLIFALLVVGLTLLFAVSWFLPLHSVWKPGGAFLLCLSFGPLSFFAASRCLRRESNRTDIDCTEEVALSLVTASLGCLVGSLTLDLGGAFADDWDSIRLFLRVLLAVCLFGAALVLVSTKLQRIMLSAVLAFHFSGIAAACLSAPPASALVTQMWIRLFRPYFEFLYLTNAYHFYAPDPSPTNSLWFRLVYESPDGKEVGWWYKLPKVDEHGRLDTGISLEYQRSLALVDPVGNVEAAPGVLDAAGKMIPFYEERIKLQPGNPGEGKIGEQVRSGFRIPLHPLYLIQLQTKRPTESSREILSSYVRFLAHKYPVHPKRPDWKFKRVKAYFVVHAIAQPGWLIDGVPPTDPTLYNPFYMGDYEADGTWNLSDPYMSWLMPVLRFDANDLGSRIHDYARLHAGDPEWVRPQWTPEEGKEPPDWVEPTLEELRRVLPERER